MKNPTCKKIRLIGKAVYNLTFPALLLASSSFIGCGDNESSTVFEVLIQNRRAEFAETASNGSRFSFALGPTTWVVHENSSPLYTLGTTAPANGIEAFAEDANPNDLIENVRTLDSAKLIGLVTADTSELTESVLAPGETYRFLVASQAGGRLSFAVPYLQANDVILGTSDTGIALFDDAGNPVSGDVTSQIQLLDIGTEVNQEPGIGADQLVRQTADNTGASESLAVAPVSDGFTYPAVSDAVSVTINVVGSTN